MVLRVRCLVTRHVAKLICGHIDSGLTLDHECGALLIFCKLHILAVHFHCIQITVAEDHDLHAIADLHLVETDLK